MDLTALLQKVPVLVYAAIVVAATVTYVMIINRGNKTADITGKFSLSIKQAVALVASVVFAMLGMVAATIVSAHLSGSALLTALVCWIIISALFVVMAMNAGPMRHPDEDVDHLNGTLTH
jgi:phosphotransferase system  glucose/maltose/N-acetylglucosamine-specific IIC component